MMRHRRNMTGRLPGAGIAILAVAAALAAAPALAAGPAGIIRDFQILSTAPAYGGATPPGAAGPYEVITGIVHGALDPASPLNAGMADLRLAPRAADGMVDYSTDVVMLRPVHAADARRLLIYEVVNRGRKLGIPIWIGGGALVGGKPAPADFPSALRSGATFVWSGWQSDVRQSGTTATADAAPIGTDFPVAVRPDGKPITGLSREEYIPDYAGGPPNLVPLTYPPADPAQTAGVSFTVRQSWLTAYGRTPAGIPSYKVPASVVTRWHYVTEADGSAAVAFTPPPGVPGPDGKTVRPDTGTIYSFVYRAKNPVVASIGFAAVRDLVRFLRDDAADAQGHPNPLADLRGAKCVLGACPAKPAGNFDTAVGVGISQSGRFLRDFLYRGFNQAAAGRPVFDALMPIIAGSRRTWIDARFAQPGRWSKEHEDHWQRGDQAPFTYGEQTDPFTQRTDGLLRRCTASHTCPKIMQIDGAFEWWGARAALVVTDGRGHDVKLPGNVRYYFIAGTRHGGGDGLAGTQGMSAMPAAGSDCQMPNTPVSESPVERALLDALIGWTARDVPPPASRYPTVAAGTLISPAREAAAFPRLADAMVPLGPQARPTAIHLTGALPLNQIEVTDYSSAVPVVHLDERYTVLVPRTDRNGNATSGIRLPDVAVPLASYTGWAMRAEGHAVGESCQYAGTAIPLAVDRAAQAGGTDGRATLADLYPGRAAYLRGVTAAAEALVAKGYLLPADAQSVFIEPAAQVSPKLIPKP